MFIYVWLICGVCVYKRVTWLGRKVWIHKKYKPLYNGRHICQRLWSILIMNMQKVFWVVDKGVNINGSIVTVYTYSKNKSEVLLISSYRAI